MKHKKIIILLALTIFVLLSIGSVCASDADDTAISSEDESQIGLSQDNVITDNLESIGEDTPLTQMDNDDETLAVENTPNALGAGEGTYSDLRDEIGNGGNIELNRSNYIYSSGDGDTIKITSPSVIDGKGAVIDMAGVYIRAFEVSTNNVTIKNLTIKNVKSYGEGGAFYFNGGNVTITNCNFFNNSAQDGGAIYFNASNVIVSDCIFTNNSAFFDGGAINLNCTNFTATNCIFTNNNATGYGGDCGEGGAIHVFSDDTFTYIDKCEFTNNTAIPGDPQVTDMWESNAGAVDADGDTVITNSKFVNNYASTGGAISLSWSDASRISNCNFTNNSALSAGAFENLNSNVTIEGSIFDGNKALKSSGAIKNDFEGILSIIGCIFTGNTAPYGCAIYNDIDAVGDMGQLTIVDSTFTSNGGVDDYSIYNEGNLTLAGNNVDNIIYNNGIITSTTNVTVLANKTVNVKYGETVTLNATFTDDNGNLIEDENLRFTVDGVVVPVKSSYAGGVYTATYIPDKAGQKIVSVGLDYDATVKTATIIVNKVGTQLSAKAVTTTYNVAKNLVVTLKDAYGNAVSNAKITIYLNGKTVKVTTDKNGQAKLAINLPAKKYTAKIAYRGDNSHIKSTTAAKVVVKKASPKIVAKKKTFKVKTKAKKYVITLKDNKGKAIKRAKVTLKVKGKTYKAKTSSKGKATFKITKLTKKGKYKATIKYAGNNNFNAVTKTIKYITVKK